MKALELSTQAECKGFIILLQDQMKSVMTASLPTPTAAAYRRITNASLALI